MSPDIARRDIAGRGMGAVGPKALSVNLKCAGQRVLLQKTTIASRYFLEALNLQSAFAHPLFEAVGHPFKAPDVGLSGDLGTVSRSAPALPQWSTLWIICLMQ